MQKNIYFCFIDNDKAFDCVDHKKCGKFLKRCEYQTTVPVLRNLFVAQEAAVRKWEPSYTVGGNAN